MIRLLLGALLTIQALSAQFVPATNCIHQAGDNPDWARPDFDDSQWAKAFPAIGSPYVWTRCRIDLRSLPPAAPIHIGVASYYAWELFVDGVPAGSFGNIRTGFASADTFQLRKSPPHPPQRQSVTVALRQLPGRNFLGGSFAPKVAVGQQDSLLLVSSNVRLNILWQIWPSLAAGAISLVIGYVLLVLYAVGGGGSQREMLWFGMFSLIFGTFRAFNALLAYGVAMPGWFCLFADGLLFSVMYLITPAMFYAMAGRSLPRFYSVWSWAYALLSLIPALVALLAPIEFAQRAAGLNSLRIPLGLISHSAAVVAFWPLWRVAQPLRWYRNLCLLWAAGAAAFALPGLAGLPGIALQLGGDFRAMVVIVTLLGMFIVIARRHRKIALDRIELQGEMKSAQEVQRLLVSSVSDVARWAAVEVAYLPAKEVGGDFYFCRQTPAGQLIVVGDVSGKGLRAAMLASVAMGAIRNSTNWSPGPLLRNLNAALHGQTGGGFVTCCAALIQNDGHLIVANAGHPSAYGDGREVEMESGLPLGIALDVEYTESVTRGERFTFISDGVVEAENAQRELFGFDRTREISGKPAHEIADAAKAWGQNDDITVVTVRRVG